MTRVPTREFITAARAAELIACNHENNRKPSRATVLRYATDMAHGDWDESSPAPIIVSDDGKLLDGSHRMHALVESGVSGLHFYVLYAASPATMLAVDQGRPRKPHEVLTMHTDERVSRLAASVLTQYVAQPNNRKKMSPAQMCRAWSRHRDVVSWAASLKNGVTLAGVSTVPVLTAFARASGHGFEQSRLKHYYTVFCDRGTGEGAEYRVGQLLRQKICHGMGGSKASSLSYLLAARAILAAGTGEELQVLRVPRADPFPLLETNE